MAEIISTDVDVDNDKVLEKLHVLLDKYHHYARVAIESGNDDGEDTIPILTECVTLRSKQLQSQFDELSPLRLLLDAALIDAKINLGPADRQALVHALEDRIIIQEKALRDCQNSETSSKVLTG